MKCKIKSIIKKIIKYLNEIEPILRLVEVIFVVVGIVFVSTKTNRLAEMQLELDKQEIQPVFDVLEIIESNLEGEEKANSKLVVSILSGTCNNVEIEVVCFATLHYFSGFNYVQKDFQLSDFYYAKSTRGNKQGVICTMTSQDNWKDYCKLQSDVLNSDRIDTGYLDLFRYVKIVYEDGLNNWHTNYYKVNPLETKLLEEEKGLEAFGKYEQIKDSLYIEQLSIENIIKLIK